MVEPQANYECDHGMASKEGIPQTFDMDFELRGNFTFTWFFALDNIGLKSLCGNHHFLIKELVRRTHFGAIPVVPLDSTRFLKLNESDIKFEPQLSYVYSGEVDISLDRLPVSSLLMPYMDITHSEVSPTISLMGGFYPNTESNPLFGVFNVFYFEIWILILITLFVSPIVPTIESLFSIKQKRTNQSYGQHLWNACNAMFMPTFDFKYLNRWSNRIIIGFLLIFKVFDSTLFSSQILSITIEDNYYVIDSFEDLNKKSDLKPVFLMPLASIDQIKNEPELKNVLNRMSEKDYLDFDLGDLVLHIDEFLDKINVKHSHIAVMSPILAEVLIGINPNKHKEITHISRKHYLESVQGYVFNKKMDPFLRKTFQEVISSSNEAGHPQKTLALGLYGAYLDYADKSFVSVAEIPVLQMKLDEFKIALGSFIVCILLSFLSLLYENQYSVHSKPDIISHKLDKQSGSLAPIKKNTLVLKYPVPRALPLPVYYLRNGIE